MKKLVLLILISIVALQANSQCSDVLIDSARVRLGEATYLNTFRLLMKKGKKNKIPLATFKIQMSKGNIYRFVAVDAQENKSFLICNISDDYNKYGESFDKFEQVNYGGFDFKCTKSGVYYLSGFFKNGEAGCGVIVMSLLKVQNQYVF